MSDKSSSLIFRALADPTRRAILAALRRGPLLAGQVAARFPQSRPAVSRHLRVLRQAHLVAERRHGRHRITELNPEPLRQVDDWIADYRPLWSARLGRLKSLVEKGGDHERPDRKR